VFAVYLHIKFHTPSFNGSLVITISLKVKYTFRIVAMLLFYFIQKSGNKFILFLKMYHNINVIYYRELKGTKVVWLSMTRYSYKFSLKRVPGPKNY